MTNIQENRIFPAPQTTLIDIHHPTFLQGYQTGRRWYFEDPEPMTDKRVVELLDDLFRERDTENPQEQLYFYAGHLLGKISGPYIPRQPHEEDPRQKHQERFLAKVTSGYGEEGGHLAEDIRQLWKIHARLTQRLDADDFDQLLRHGVEKVL